ncbi:MAG TPA: sugar ABC transporter permease [Candidatus Ornithocaccomicrobium faecavium]|uniref:Sugar ABC transporter permease n=1 Tax=Candidatus Ornithocaccomicrobium faecavium TaxID=2840890 RepID=A0A9D1P6V4_9FIRM|nr:sugar ABC transporter permease [Clostridiales bacterium]HIV27661.1 sugar ABC transporter permease [Candidatus Ornithocaccomicrobium faecavium]
MIRTYAGSPARALRKKQWANTRRLMRRFWQLYLFVLPPIITTFIWHYIPLYGVVIAFKDYKVIDGILGSDWAGLEHFMAFFRDPYFEPILWNTIRISLYSFATFPCSIIFALMINELTNHKFKKTVQMISYMPHFISTVVVCAMVHMFFNVDGGIVNNAIVALGGEPVPFMYKAKYFDHLYVWSGVWQGIGWGTIIYLANLSNVSPDLIEAARIDGASRWDVVVHINIPTILPTVVIMLILRVGSIMGVGFEKVFLLQTDLNLSASRVISTYVYERTLGAGGTTAYWDYSAAIGLFNTFINLILIILTNTIARKVSDIALW